MRQYIKVGWLDCSINYHSNYSPALQRYGQVPDLSCQLHAHVRVQWKYAVLCCTLLYQHPNLVNHISSRTRSQFIRLRSLYFNIFSKKRKEWQIGNALKGLHLPRKNIFKPTLLNVYLRQFYRFTNIVIILPSTTQDSINCAIFQALILSDFCFSISRFQQMVLF